MTGIALDRRRTLNVSRRIWREMRHDRRSLALVLVVPTLVTLLIGATVRETNGAAVLQRFAPGLLSVFTLIFMFQLTSVSFVRERTTGTLERLLTTPATNADLTVGYLLGYGPFGAASTALAVGVAIGVLDIDVVGSVWLIVVFQLGLLLVAIAMGILASAVAQNEFQAIQMMAPLVVPQVIIGGVLFPPDAMPRWLEVPSQVLPMRYVVDGMRGALIDGASLSDGEMLRAGAAVFGFALAFGAAAVASMRRRV